MTFRRDEVVTEPSVNTKLGCQAGWEEAEVSETPEDRRALLAEAELSELRKVTERWAAKRCGVRYSGKSVEFSCLDQQAFARDTESRCTDGFREQVLDPDYPCFSCQAREALARASSSLKASSDALRDEVDGPEFSK